MVTYFIADLHLSDERPDIVEAFSQFLHTDAYQAEAVYILGDLFEVWVGDDIHSETSDRVARELSALTSAGIPCYFIAGNRDFLLGKRYFDACGVKELADETIIDLYGQRTMLLHGDIMCTRDEAYQKFRRRVHNRLIQWLFLHLPKKTRQHIAAKMRKHSQSENQSKDTAIMDVTPEEVTQRFQSYQLTQMIHGHTHRPNIHYPFRDQRVRIVLGDWYEQSSILTVTPQGHQLSGSHL